MYDVCECRGDRSYVREEGLNGGQRCHLKDVLRVVDCYLAFFHASHWSCILAGDVVIIASRIGIFANL
jgi:hypothetical protein